MAFVLRFTWRLPTAQVTDEYCFGLLSDDFPIGWNCMYSGRREPASESHRSTASTVVERSTLNADGIHLNYTTAVADPETLTEPAELTSTRVLRPGEQMKAYNCTTSKPVS
jgi:hypothetical protein